jgi:hypothetical protein
MPSLSRQLQSHVSAFLQLPVCSESRRLKASLEQPVETPRCVNSTEFPQPFAASFAEKTNLEPKGQLPLIGEQARYDIQCDATRIAGGA